jgi:hypothetical protein
MASYNQDLKITKDFILKNKIIFVVGANFYGQILDQRYANFNMLPQCMPLPCLKIAGQNSDEFLDPNNKEDMTILDAFISSLIYQIKNKPNTNFYIQNIGDLPINKYSIVPFIKNQLENELKECNNVTFLWSPLNCT